jgi:hypothetical protein
MDEECMEASLRLLSEKWPRYGAECGIAREVSAGGLRLRLSRRRVGLVYRDPDAAHSLVGRWLAPGGKAFAFFDPSGASAA